MDLYNHLMGGSKKRLQGIATKKEAIEARDKYYENQSNYRGKLLDMVYQKNPKFTLFTCDKPEFVKCREENPNNDGKGNTCLDVAKKVCPKYTRGSAKYTRAKNGPHTFDVEGVDYFTQGKKIKIDDKVIKSVGLPKSLEKGVKGEEGYKKSQTNSEIARKQYAERKLKTGFKPPVMFKKKPEKNQCKYFRKNRGKKCDEQSKCKWVNTVGCVEREETLDIKETKDELDETLMEISSDDEESSDKEEGSDEESECHVLLVLDEAIINNIKNNSVIPEISNEHDYIICLFEGKLNLYILLNNGNITKLGSLKILNRDIIKIKEVEKDIEILENILSKHKNILEFIPIDKSGGGVNIANNDTFVLNDNMSETSSVLSDIYILNNKTGKIYTNDGKFTLVGTFDKGCFNTV